MLTQDYKNEMSAAIVPDIVEQLRKDLAPRLMNSKQTAIYMGQKSETAFRQKVSKGFFPQSMVVHIGKSVYYDRKFIDEWIDQQ